jgi:hypothetical protein
MDFDRYIEKVTEMCRIQEQINDLSNRISAMEGNLHPEDALDTLRHTSARPFLTAMFDGATVTSPHTGPVTRQKVIDGCLNALDAHVSALPVDWD